MKVNQRVTILEFGRYRGMQGTIIGKSHNPLRVRGKYLVRVDETGEVLNITRLHKAPKIRMKGVA